MAKGFLSGYKTYDTSTGFGNAKKWRKAFEQRFSKEEAGKILQDHADTPHGILGIQPYATPDQIKAAFRKLIKQWHPDLNKHRVAEAMSKRLIAAYSLLL